MTYYNEKGIKRFLNAMVFSYHGLLAAWKHEEAFRQELIVFFLAWPLAVYISSTHLELLILMGSILLVLIIEILNSAIEAVVDRAGTEYHDLAKRAKDMGSAAVMLTISLALMSWGLVIF